MINSPTRQAEQTDTLLTVADVADLYAVTTRTIWRYVAAGRIPRPYKLGEKTLRWKATEVQAHLDSLPRAD